MTDDKRQINVRLEPELYDFLAKYSKRNFKTMTGVLREMLVELYHLEAEKGLPLVVKDR